MKSKSYKIYLFLKGLYLKIILRCSNKIFLLACIKIQQCLFLSNSTLSIAKIQKMSLLICIKYLHCHETDEYIKFANEEPEFVKKANALVEDWKDLRDLLADYHRVLSFYWDICGNTEFTKAESEKYFIKAQNLSMSIEKLNKKSFTELNKKMQNEHRIAKKELKIYLNTIIHNAAYDIIPKIEITTTHVNFILSICATIFILTGYLYNRYYLGHYGIEVSSYFTMSDYISSSIDKIYIACIATVFSIVGFLKGMLERSRIEVESLQLEIESYDYDKPMTVFVTAMTIFTIVAFSANLPGKYMFLSMLILFAVMGIFTRIPIEKMIKNSTYVKITFVAIIVFFVEIFWAVTNNIDIINRVSAENFNKYKFNFKTANLNNFNNFIFLSSNSNYLFFYDKKKRQSYILPRNEISSIETK